MSASAMDLTREKIIEGLESVKGLIVQGLIVNDVKGIAFEVADGRTIDINITQDEEDGGGWWTFRLVKEIGTREAMMDAINAAMTDREVDEDEWRIAMGELGFIGSGITEAILAYDESTLDREEFIASYERGRDLMSDIYKPKNGGS